VIAFLSCLNFALGSYWNYVLALYVESPSLSLPTLVPQGGSALFVIDHYDKSSEVQWWKSLWFDLH